MEKWTIGSVIKKLREGQGLTQSQLCHGLCTTATLSKFENGELELDYFLVVAFMQRLGYGLDKFEFYGSDMEWKQWEAMYGLNQLRIEKRWEELQSALDTYRQCWKDRIEKNPMQKQLLLLTEGVLEAWSGHDTKAEKLLQTAISCTIPEWADPQKTKGVVSTQELVTLMELGRLYDRQGKKTDAERIWISIWDGIGKNPGRIKEQLSIYISMTIQISEHMFDIGNYWDGLSCCDKGLRVLSRYSRIDQWSDLLYWKAKFQERLLEMDELEEEDLLKTYRRAYAAARLFGERERAKELKACLEQREVLCIE